MVLNIIEELMCKTQEEFLDHFARLGVFSKVQALMEPENETDSAVSTQTSAIAAINDEQIQCGGVSMSSAVTVSTVATLVSAGKFQFR